MSNALIYCRVSTEEQAEQGYSLDAQEKFCRNYAKSNGLQAVAVFRDEGRSGTSLDRPGLQDLLTRAAQRDVAAVIVQETDRLARNTVDHLMIKKTLRATGTKLISVAQPMLDDSPEGNMIDTIIASVNQFQSDLNGRKTKKGMQERFETGWWPGWAPLGYLNAVEGEDDRVVVPDPDRWTLVRRALKLYITGNYSVDELADRLHRKGLTGKHGKKLSNSIMTGTLKNPFYAGIMVWNGQRGPGRHKPMIGLDEHRRILEIFDAHNMHASRSRKHRFLLAGFAFCKICGGRYTAEHHPRKSVSYYHCDFRGKRGRDKPHRNRGQNVSVDELEDQVAETFKGIEVSDQFVSMVEQKVRAVYAEQHQDRDAKKRVLLNRKLAVERRRDVAEAKLLSGVISDTDFGRIKGKIETQLEQIATALADTDRDHGTEVEVLRDVLMLARDIGRAYQKAPSQLRRHFLGLFWERFLVQDRVIVEAVPTRLIRELVASNQVKLPGSDQVMIRGHWLPSPALFITLRDQRYISTVRSVLNQIREFKSDRDVVPSRQVA